MIELASVIRDLREELEQAVEAGEGQALRFELGPIELEVQVAVEHSGQDGGRVRFWVVELGRERTREATDTQRIKLVLTPRPAGGTGRKVYIRGEAEPDEQ